MVRGEPKVLGHFAILKQADQCMQRIERTRRSKQQDYFRLSAELNALFQALDRCEIPKIDQGPIIARSRTILSRVPAEVNTEDAKQVLRKMQRSQRNEQVVSTVQRVIGRVKRRLIS